jgi:2-methylisocitrate lyase-like PEP mutase family enzyme
MTIDRKRHAEKAAAFLRLHRGPRILILPNVWDPLGARMLEALGYPAVATTSMAVAMSMGYDDGELITFDRMIEAIEHIASAVEVPVSADIERGYATTAGGVEANVRRAIAAGAVGVNIEDSLEAGHALRGVDEQCERLRAARAGADRESVPIVINARIDTYASGMAGSKEELLDETITRARSYLAAGADCVYPIKLGDVESLTVLRDAIDGAPINVYAIAGTAPLRELEVAGIRRVSLGPGLLKSGVATMKRAAEALLNYGSYDVFTDGALTNDELRALVRTDSMR